MNVAIKRAPMISLVWAQAKAYENHGQRPGQALFNALTVYCPALAEEIRGTDADPYYTEDPKRFRALAENIAAKLS